jgi:hypothetical protein
MSDCRSSLSEGLCDKKVVRGVIQCSKSTTVVRKLQGLLVSDLRQSETVPRENRI